MPAAQGRRRKVPANWDFLAQNRQRSSEERLIRSAVKADAARGLYRAVFRTPEGRGLRDKHETMKMDHFFRDRLEKGRKSAHFEPSRRGYIGRHKVLELISAAPRGFTQEELRLFNMELRDMRAEKAALRAAKARGLYEAILKTEDGRLFVQYGGTEMLDRFMSRFPARMAHSARLGYVGSYRILEPVFVGNPSVYKGMARMRKIELSNQKKSLDFGTFLRLRKAVLNGRMDINLVILPVRKLLLDDPAVRKKLKERERKAKQ